MSENTATTVDQCPRCGHFKSDHRSATGCTADQGNCGCIEWWPWIENDVGARPDQPTEEKP